MKKTSPLARAAVEGVLPAAVLNSGWHVDREELRRATISSPPLGSLPNDDPAGQEGGQGAHRLDALGRVYRGHEGVRASWERWLEDFEAYGFEVERISDHGSRVMVTAVEHGRGSASAATVSSRLYSVFTFRAGKILRYQEFYDERQALEALEATD